MLDTFFLGVVHPLFRFWTLLLNFETLDRCYWEADSLSEKFRKLFFGHLLNDSG